MSHNYNITECIKMESSLLEAKEVYVLMQNDYRISRNIRAQWFFRNLNKTLTFKWKTCQLECTEEIEVISAIPKYKNFKVDSETNSSCIKIVPDTKVNFLSTQYRLVFCIDLSSSVATIDVQHGSIYFSDIYSSLAQSLKELSEPFFVPGSRFFFIPQIFITVIAHIPNSVVATPQVLVQGWVLVPENVNILLECLKEKLKHMCNLVQTSNSVREEQMQLVMPYSSSGPIVNGTLDGNKIVKKFIDLSADISTLKIIRYGILALQLLPENSSAGIVVITDGVISFPNCKSLDSLLTQLRNSTIACSFLQLGSPFHPFASFGRVPYTELMKFIANATYGAYFQSYRNLTETSRVNETNMYHEALLFWSFQNSSPFLFMESFEFEPAKKNYWNVQNQYFYTVAHQSRVRKKHTEGTLKVSLKNLLSCRLREGYTVKSVSIDEAKNSTEVCLVLPWMLSTNIEYLVTSVPGRKSTSDIPSCHFEVIVDGCYEFLHDVTCSDKKPIKSLYRKTVITQFWSYIKNLSNTDQILMQLHSFAHNPVYYTIPEIIKNGVPLFYFPSNSSMPILFSKNVVNVQFTSFWKPLCMLDINVWQKWMHAHRIGVILQHDMPLPKNMYLPNSSGRYVHIQCRQATAALNSLLSEHGSFTLVENHSYIKLLFDDQDKPPVSFYVIRVTSKPPCVVIRLAFLGGLPGHQRFQIVNDLRQKILNLKLTKKQSSKSLSNVPESTCCVLLKKPVEKILIRYEKLPTNFNSPVPDSQFSVRNLGSHKHTDSSLYADALVTLSKYLQQQRWIWTLQYETNTSLCLTSASKILSTLTNIRLEEGFHFSHSGSGIIYMVQEFPVHVFCREVSDQSSPNDVNCCVVQYIIFPPHTNTTVKDSTSEEDDTELTEADGELQLITECWAEPQLGITVMPEKVKYLDGLKFSEISNALYKKDLEVVTILTTFEHLCILCQNSGKFPGQLLPLQSPGNQRPILQSSPAVKSSETVPKLIQENIFANPYCFKLLSLLPKSSQTEIIFSALHESDPSENKEENVLNDFLFSCFIENIRYFRHQEIPLSLEENLQFALQVHHRNQEGRRDPIPFPHPDIGIFDMSSSSMYTDFNIDRTCCNYRNNSVSELTECSHRPLLDPVLHEDKIPKWKCFAKTYSSSHVILTFVPASFKDMTKLYPQTCSVASQSEIAESSKANTSQNESCVENICGDVSEADGGVAEDNESSIQENQFSASPELLYIPVYVYSCMSSVIIDQLVNFNRCDKIVDKWERYTFSYDNCNGEPSVDSSHVVIPSPYEEESEIETKKPKRDPSLSNLKEHYSCLEKAYSKAFVYSVYRSLLMNTPVHKFDAIAAIDEICEENLTEIDITDFIFMICGHVKDFMTKHSVRRMHFSEDNEQKSSDITPSGLEKITEKCAFPLSLLQKHQPCEHLHQKHLDIKEKFMTIIQNFFKVIPSRLDYFYFSPVREGEEDEGESLGIEKEQVEDIGAVNESVVEFGEECPESESNKVETVLVEKACAGSINTDSSLSSIEKDSDSSSFSNEHFQPPLFVHFSCSIWKNKQEMKSCPLISLPTCLNDVISCLDPTSSEINLEDIRVTLDMTCLTIPNDIENPDVERQRVYSTSFSSTSPIPEPECYSKQQADNDEDSCDSDVPSDTIQGGILHNLSCYQRNSVFKCIEKIKWLLQDEKASVSLNSYPITFDTLNMIVQHIKSSKGTPSCIIKEIPLMFVYGPDNSIDKFIQAFIRMSPIGYHLNVVNDLYYLVLDADAAKKINCPFGSLDPPLGIAKYNIVKRNPHADDCTELKKMALGIKYSSVFGGHSVDDKLKPSNSRFKFVTRKDFNFIHDDDSETEDGNAVHRPKFHRKTSIKKHFQPRKRCYSSPLLHPVESEVTLEDRPRTAPPNLSLSMQNLHMEDKDESRIEKISVSRNTKVENWEYESGSPFGSSPDPSMGSKDLHLTSSVTSVSRFRPPDSVGSPVTYSEAECGSFHLSNTEDGYDGDSSDSGSDWDWLSTLDTRRPVLPKFWLIMSISDNKVIVYFHMRERSEDDPELIHCKSILSEVISIVSDICKEVNQILLLQTLYETHMCNRLLVPEDNDDLWKNRDLDPNHSLSVDDDSHLEDEDKFLEATMKLEPGCFSCPVVWVTHFKLHHRLISTSPGSKSIGIQALRSILSTFSVNNRENMFVYQENTGSVFYLRLFEEICEENHFGISKPEDTTSLIGSCSSLQSIPPKRLTVESEDADFRPRVNSGASDSYRQDSISTTSASKRNQKCVVLYVHGIGEVGTSITQDLVQALQNRLNETILDRIINMLSRNQFSMLTPEDVQFIQNPGQPPSHEIHFTLPMKLLGYAHCIHIYLRQNMLNILYNPKYSDNRREYHFKAYSHNPTEWAQVNENDIFLCHFQPTSGHPGGKGISCVVLSLVTGQGAPYQNFSNVIPDPNAYQEGFSESEFEDLTSTSFCSILKKDRSPGPVALIRFQIWSVGKDAIKQLEAHLENAVRQALWDLLMEYRALTSPISESSYMDDSSCYSEPTTPIRVRRSGIVGIDTNNQLKDFHSSTSLQTSKEMSSSVPDIASKTHSPPSLMKDMTFKFGSGPQSAKPEFHTESSKNNSHLSMSPSNVPAVKRNLNPMYYTFIKPFLQFGDKLDCSALSKRVYTLPSRHSVYTVTKEIQTLIKTVLREFPIMYLEVKNAETSDIEYIPINSHGKSHFGSAMDSKPGVVQNFIIIARNEKQWKAYMGAADFMKFQESNSESMKGQQKFLTHCCSLNTENPADSVPSSPTYANKPSSAVGSPQSKSSNVAVVESLKTPPTYRFVPRQRLFLMYIEDKEITIYLYNYSQDCICSLFHQLTQLIVWHHQRNCLLNSIILQKTGIFHGISSFRLEKASIIEEKAGTDKASQEPIVSKPASLEQLVYSQGPPKDSASSSSRSSLSLKPGYFIRSLKNLKPQIPFHLSHSSNIEDPVTAHGKQLLEAVSTQRKDMQVLYNMWTTRGSSVNYPFERVLVELKRLARLSHYCLTPILFSPSWRWKVAPIRDHGLDLPELHQSAPEKPEPVVPSRSRHSSGSSLKNTDQYGSSGSSSRSRRFSGSTYPNSNQSSPKLKIKTPSEETWHTVTRHYLQEYVQYLHTLGFVCLQTSDTTSIQSSRRNTNAEEKLSRSDSFTSHRHSMRGPPVFYLIKCLLGGLLVFEVGLSEPYAYSYLYSVESTRFKAYSTRSSNSQFIAAFLDELDKVKFLMHLHSFTYDYHLRTIHSYISGHQLIFRHGYHLTSFLDDFIKYYQKAPTGAHNLLHAGTLTINDINMSAAQLYNYIISHNRLYGMTVLRMVPVVFDSNIDTEFALVELSAQKASYKDFNDVFQMGNFDFALLINHNTLEVSPDSNTLVLNFYIILTSQRDLYPKLSNLGTSLGSFKTVRYGSTAQTSSSCSSRKTSTVSMVTEKDKFESSGEESTSSTDSKSRSTLIIRSMCDEDVTYLGYFSNQETMIQRILQQQAEAAQFHLKAVVHRASVHCRRDSLWSSLLLKSLKDDNSSKEHSSSSSYSDFAELLELVTVIPLSDIDEKLTPFMNMSISWYAALAPVLKSKYMDSHREYISSDNSSLYMVVTNIQCPDSFLLLSVDIQAKRAELNVVFREPPDNMEQSGKEPSLRTITLYSFIEDFVNACCFHLWCSIL